MFDAQDRVRTMANDAGVRNFTVAIEPKNYVRLTALVGSELKALLFNKREMMARQAANKSALEKLADLQREHREGRV